MLCMEECDERERGREGNLDEVIARSRMFDERTGKGEMRKSASKPKFNHNQIDSSFSSPYIIAA